VGNERDATGLDLISERGEYLLAPGRARQSNNRQDLWQTECGAHIRHCLICIAPPVKYDKLKPATVNAAASVDLFLLQTRQTPDSGDVPTVMASVKIGIDE
jgi:hypothetical protein